MEGRAGVKGMDKRSDTMRILMLGNSFIFTNDLPQILAALTGGEVVHHTRGGARLAEQLNPNTRMGSRTLAALARESWDYVVLQEMSNGPITAPDRFLESVAGLCRLIGQNGATPVLYATWAYEKGSEKLGEMGMDYGEMTRRLSRAYHQAAAQNHALVADVGLRFYEHSEGQGLYAPDGVHPNGVGTRIAAETIASVILNHAGGAEEGRFH